MKNKKGNPTALILIGVSLLMINVSLLMKNNAVDLFRIIGIVIAAVLIGVGLFRSNGKDRK